MDSITALIDMLNVFKSAIPQLGDAAEQFLFLAMDLFAKLIPVMCSIEDYCF